MVSFLAFFYSFSSSILNFLMSTIFFPNGIKNICLYHRMHTRNSSKCNTKVPKLEATVPMYGIIRHNDAKLATDLTDCEGPIDLSIGKRRTEDVE